MGDGGKYCGGCCKYHGVGSVIPAMLVWQPTRPDSKENAPSRRQRRPDFRVFPIPRSRFVSPRGTPDDRLDLRYNEDSGWSYSAPARGRASAHQIGRSRARNLLDLRVKSDTMERTARFPWRRRLTAERPAPWRSQWGPSPEHKGMAAWTTSFDGPSRCPYLRAITGAARTIPFLYAPCARRPRLVLWAWKHRPGWSRDRRIAPSIFAATCAASVPTSSVTARS